SVSNYRLEDLARDIGRTLLAVAGGDRNTRDNIEQAIERLRDHAREFFAELAFAHHAGDRGRASGDRVRAPPASLPPVAASAASLTGALDVVESTLVALVTPSADDDAVKEQSEEISSLARRARELRDEVRLLVRGDAAEYVYFVEFRGRGIFLRAAPV